MSSVAMWLLGVTCHLWRNRQLVLITGVLLLPLLTVACLRVSVEPMRERPEQLR